MRESASNLRRTWNLIGSAGEGRREFRIVSRTSIITESASAVYGAKKGSRLFWNVSGPSEEKERSLIDSTANFITPIRYQAATVQENSTPALGLIRAAQRDYPGNKCSYTRQTEPIAESWLRLLTRVITIENTVDCFPFRQFMLDPDEAHSLPTHFQASDSEFVYLISVGRAV